MPDPAATVLAKASGGERGTLLAAVVPLSKTTTTQSIAQGVPDSELPDKVAEIGVGCGKA